MNDLANRTADIDLNAGKETPVKVERPLWQRELLWSAGTIAASLTVLPVLIYIVGNQLLGAYGGGGTLGSFFQHFFGNLLRGSWAAWSVAVGPALILAALRYLLTAPFHSAIPVELQNTAPTSRGAHNKDHPVRREPFIGS
jgi:hypothetical protein